MGVDIEALKQLTDAKGMPLEQLIQAIEAGVLTAYSETPEPNRYARVQLDRETGEIAIFVPEFNELGSALPRICLRWRVLIALRLPLLAK